MMLASGCPIQQVLDLWREVNAAEVAKPKSVAVYAERDAAVLMDTASNIETLWGKSI